MRLTHSHRYTAGNIPSLSGFDPKVINIKRVIITTVGKCFLFILFKKEDSLSRIVGQIKDIVKTNILVFYNIYILYNITYSFI